MLKLITIGLHLFSFLSLCGVITLKPANAQISSDATLSTKVTSDDGLNFTIKHGNRVGNNLFHSFKEFSVPTGGSAVFNNATEIQNILGRVTGGNISNIDGLIRANGTANLFLLNPSGIIFGPGASLDIGGSFIGSTADSILFPKNVEFSATDTNTAPLLTVNVPLGLQYGTNPGNIAVNGTGNRLSLDPNTFAVNRRTPPTGLQVQPGKTLALVGGNVSLIGGNLSAEEGRIELGGVSGATVNLTDTDSGWEFNYKDINVNNFGDVSLASAPFLRSASSVDVSGKSGGTIQVQGKNISVINGSAILADTLDNGTGGSLTIKATESVEVSGTSAPPIPFMSRLSTDVAPGATGVGGSLSIDTNTLQLNDGGQISTGTFGFGDAGNMKVTAEDVQVIGASSFGPSGLFAPVAPIAQGAGGNILLKTNRLQVNGGGQISTITFGAGNAGNLDIDAEEIELVGTLVNDFGEFPSGLLANVERGATGNGGNLTVESSTVKLRDGAQIVASTFGMGNAGNLTMEANKIELTGVSSGGNRSAFFANVEDAAIGKGGILNLKAQSLRLANGAEIGATVFGVGDGSSVTIKANNIELIGSDELTGIFTTVASKGTGIGGNLQILTDNLRVVDGSQIAVSTGGSGNAGSMEVTATQSIEIIGKSSGGSSGLFGNAIIGNGDGGNLNITTEQLNLKDGATISVSNFSSRNRNNPPGQGKAGDINIEAKSVIIDSTTPENPSSINASTLNRGGGSIHMQIQESLIARNGSQILATTSGTGDGGTININSKYVGLNSDAEISTNSTGDGQAGNIKIEFERLETNRGKITATSEKTGGGDITLNATASEIFLRNNSLVSTSVLDSTGGGGNIAINADVIAGLENSDIQANAVLGPGGNINITTQGVFGIEFRDELTEASDITASSQFGVKGTVDIENLDIDPNSGLVELPLDLLDLSQQIVNRCSGKTENTFIVTGRGGIPQNPSTFFNFNNSWSDLRDISVSPKGNNNASELRNISNQPAIVEATHFIRNSNGEIELVASQSKPFMATPVFECSS